MPLKDRLKSKQSENLPEITDVQPAQSDTVEFKVSTEKLTKKILSVKDNANLGAIVKELAKFLETLTDNNTELVLKGRFDVGKKALIACLLSNISENSEIISEIYNEDSALRKKRSLKEKIRNARAKALESDEQTE